MNWPTFCKGILVGALIPISAHLPRGWPGYLWQIPLLVAAAVVLVYLDKWDWNSRAPKVSQMDSWESLPAMTKDDEQKFFAETEEP